MEALTDLNSGTGAASDDVAEPVVDRGVERNVGMGVVKTPEFGRDDLVAANPPRVDPPGSGRSRCAPMAWATASSISRGFGIGTAADLSPATSTDHAA